jgi:hypothetical protein
MNPAVVTIIEEMKTGYSHTALTLLLVLLQAGLLAAMPATELCSATGSPGGCFCGMECCSAERPASGPNPVLRDSPCCAPQDANDTQAAAVPAAKTSLPGAPRVALETVQVGTLLPSAIAAAAAIVSVPRIPSITTASIPLLNASLLI